MIDRKWIGHSFDPLTTKVESGQLAFFAKAVSDNNPVYTDLTKANTQGYEALPAPPTFGFSLNLATPDPFAYMKEMGVPLSRVLHGKQAFQYFKPIVSGDEITLRRTIVDIVSKKEGKMELITEEIKIYNQHKDYVGKMNVVTIVRN